MRRRLAQPSLWLGLGVGLFVTAYLIINTTFMLYDDEGYVLLTYRNFAAGGRLYDDIFSQYGPWPYVYHLFIAGGLHLPLTHEVGRMLTALHWVGTALLAGFVAGKLTGRTMAAVFATLITFGLLWQMSAEPSHPGSLICVMLAATAAVVTSAQAAERWTWLGAAVGLTGALLVLTKINIGVLFIAGAGVAALRLTAWPGRWARPAEILATVGLLAVPWGLMGKRLDTPWVLILAIQFTAAAAGLLWVAPASTLNRRVPARTWIAAVGIFAATLFAVAGIVCGRGTSLPALLQAVLIDPLRHPASFMVRFTWLPAVWPVAVACWLVTVLAGAQLRRTGELGVAIRNAVIALRLGAAIAFVFSAQTWLTIFGPGHFIVFCLPLLPVFMIPLGRKPALAADRAGVRFWAACLALPQVLHTYPVAGSQMAWGTFLLLPVFVAGLDEVWPILAAARPRLERALPPIAAGLLLLLGAGQVAMLLHTGWDRYEDSRPLGLPGARNIRAGDAARLFLRVLTLNASIHADVLFSRPGMYSYNIWSGVPTPTTHNATHWFWLLDAGAQGDIINRLRQVPRTAVITSTIFDEFLGKIQVPMNGPLQSYIQDHYRPLLTLGELHFLVPKESRAVPFGQLEILVPSGPGGPDQFATLLQANVVLDGQPASVQLQAIEAPWTTLADTAAASGSKILLEPITTQGEPAGPVIELPQRRPLKGLFRLKAYLNRPLPAASLHDLMLVVRDPDGATLSESVY